MNPETNRFEALMLDRDDGSSNSVSPNRAERRKQAAIERALNKRLGRLLRPNGEPVPQHWTQFRVGEDVVIKDYTFRVAYIGETSILFEPVGPCEIGK